jgi:hypothetical protein
MLMLITTDDKYSHAENKSSGDAVRMSGAVEDSAITAGENLMLDASRLIGS